MVVHVFQMMQMVPNPANNRIFKKHITATIFSYDKVTIESFEQGNVIDVVHWIFCRDLFFYSFSRDLTSY